MPAGKKVVPGLGLGSKVVATVAPAPVDPIQGMDGGGIWFVSQVGIDLTDRLSKTLGAAMVTLILASE